jgi:hypothetical protein
METDLAENFGRAAVPVRSSCDEGWPGQDYREHRQIPGRTCSIS